MKTPTTSIEIDLDAFSKEELISLISAAHKRNLTFNELIVEILSIFLRDQEKLNKIQSIYGHDKSSF